MPEAALQILPSPTVLVEVPVEAPMELGVDFSVDPAALDPQAFELIPSEQTLQNYYYGYKPSQQPAMQPFLRPLLDALPLSIPLQNSGIAVPLP